ncbi:MAG: hypothetical protein U9Q04_04950 [Campylobacterota bacterium]|nr:hypothetical protein [Campylobacterota bacterium]
MTKSYKQSMNRLKNNIKDILDIFINDNKLIIDIVENCSQKAALEGKNRLNDENISNRLEKLDSDIVDILSLKDIKKKDIKAASVYLKVNSDLSKVAKNIRTVITKLQLCSKDLEDISIKKYAVKIYKNIIKILNILKNMLVLDDLDEINDEYEQIIILESKIDNTYEDINRYIVKESSNNDPHEDVMVVLRKSEKIAARTVSIASLIKYGN